LRYKIAFKNSVSRDLKKISREHADRLLTKFEGELPEKADRFPSLPGKFSGLRTLRVGYFRVIYTIIEDTALIVRISHRQESYR
jgi:mRNA-degrading endonuclease RelE of RelBE toxin-antitoxin system